MHTTRTKPDGEVVWNYDPKDIDSVEFTFDQIIAAWHLSGTSGQNWNISVRLNDITYNDINLSVTQWLNLVKYEMRRLRQGEDPQIYVALRKSKNYWVVATECVPPFPPNGLTHDSSSPYTNDYSRETVRNALL